MQRPGQLLPAFVEDARDPGDPVFFISDAVEQMDLTAVERRYAVLGEPAYDPRLLRKRWRSAATQGVYGGREVARRGRRHVAFRCLVGDGPVPDCRTIHRFRLRHREDVAAGLRETGRLAQAAGLVRLGLVAIDGTKRPANTSRSKAMSHRRMVEAEARMEAEITALLVRLDEGNAAEDREHDEDDDGSRVAGRAAGPRAAAREAEGGPRAAGGGAGTEARPAAPQEFHGPGREHEAGWQRRGADVPDTAQAATREDGVIVAVGLTTTVPDPPPAVPMVAAGTAMTGAAPGGALFDQGDLSEANLGTLRPQGPRCLLAVGREGRGARGPRGVEPQRMHRLLRLPWARRWYARRKTQGERPVADITHARRFRRCQLRGRANGWGEGTLVAAAGTLRRLVALAVVPAHTGASPDL